MLDTAWRHIISDLGTEPKLIDLCRGNDLVVKLHDLSARLDTIRGGLFELFSRKRKAFPLFYFLNDDELLSLLVNANLGVANIEGMLHKLFPGVDCLYSGETSERDERSSEEVTILGLKSPDGEYLSLFEGLRFQVSDGTVILDHPILSNLDVIN